jgi:hypothetical protein
MFDVHDRVHRSATDWRPDVGLAIRSRASIREARACHPDRCPSCCTLAGRSNREQAGADLDGPSSEVPERVADVRMQAWRVDVAGTRVVVIIKSFSDPLPALVAEAEAIVESIYVEPVGTGTQRRLIFTLPAGWDAG